MRAAFFIAASLASILAASECIELSQRSAFRHATLVFRGGLVRVEDVEFEPSHEAQTGEVELKRASPGNPRILIFAVNRVWKGPATKIVHIFAFGNPGIGTSYPFRLHTEYIVYAGGEVGQNQKALHRSSGDAPVYDIGTCPLRIRADIARESRLLGSRGTTLK